MKVTLWVHPFVNTDSESYAQLRQSARLSDDRTGDVGMIRWWQGNGAIWDFSTPSGGDAYRAQAGCKANTVSTVSSFDGADETWCRASRKLTAAPDAQYADVYNR